MKKELPSMQHEFLLINEFVISKRKERYLNLISTIKGRNKLRKYISHFEDLETRFIHDASLLQTGEQLPFLPSLPPGTF